MLETPGTCTMVGAACTARRGNPSHNHRALQAVIYLNFVTICDLQLNPIKKKLNKKTPKNQTQKSSTGVWKIPSPFQFFLGFS